MRIGLRDGGGIGAACAVVVLLAGCAQDTAASAVSEQSSDQRASESPPFEPCTIPAPAVNGSGLIAESALSDFAGIADYPGWKGCAWDGPAENPWYFFAVLSTFASMDDYLLDPVNERQVPVTVGARSAVVYHSPDQGDPPIGCIIVLGAGNNMIILSVSPKTEQGPLGDPCEVVNRHARDLEQFLPR